MKGKKILDTMINISHMIKCIFYKMSWIIPPKRRRARPAVHFGARRERRVLSIRARLRSEYALPPTAICQYQAGFSSRISSVSVWACAASSDTAWAASPMASAVCRDMSLTWTMDWLISSEAADCSSLAVAMALT